MIISPMAIEEATLTMLAHSDKASEIALRLNGFKLFSNRTNQKIAEVCLQYISKHNQPPKAALEYLLEQDVIRGEEGKLLQQELQILNKNATQIDSSFVLTQLDQYIETQRLTIALQQSLELLQEGDLERAKEKIHTVNKYHVNGSPGIWMKDPQQALSFLDIDEEADFFSSGISLLDTLGIRPERQTLMFLIAATGKGKSWFLVNIGKSALQFHKKVLHITLELSEKKTARRYLQSMFGLTKSEAQAVRAARFLKTEGGGTSIEFNDLQRDSIINRREQVRKRIADWYHCPRWLIKQFPTGTLSAEQLVMYLDSLDKQEGFKPDILVLDYADIMRINAESLRIDTGRLYKDLRAIAVEKNIAMVSATQGNRESETAKLVNTTNVAEDWSKIGTADVVLTYSQTQEEKRLGLARIFVGKARDTSDHFLALIAQCYGIGQFATDSVMMNADLISQLQGL